jgi:hypothetical protein
MLELHYKHHYVQTSEVERGRGSSWERGRILYYDWLLRDKTLFMIETAKDTATDDKIDRDADNQLSLRFSINDHPSPVIKVKQ